MTVEENRKAAGKELRKLREAADLTQKQAASKLECGRSTIYRIECGITKRWDHVLVERAKALYQADLTPTAS